MMCDALLLSGSCIVNESSLTGTEHEIRILFGITIFSRTCSPKDNPIVVYWYTEVVIVKATQKYNYYCILFNNVF